MTLNEIIAALKSTNAVSRAALAAGVAHADGIAAVVFAVADKFCHGIHLLPAETELMFKGLHVLAAARHPGLCDQVIAIARQSAEQLDCLFPDHTAVSLAGAGRRQARACRARTRSATGLVEGGLRDA